MTSEWQGDNHKLITLVYFVNKKARVTIPLTTQKRLYQKYPKKVKSIFCTEHFCYTMHETKVNDNVSIPYHSPL